MNFRRKAQPEPMGFQIAPLIDVVFLILIWFISASIYAQWETKIGIKVPTAKTGEHLKRYPGEVVVNIDADGRVQLNTVDCGMDALKEKLRTIVRQFPDQPAVIRADSATRYKDAIAALDACREAGIHTVSFSTLPPSSGGGP